MFFSKSKLAIRFFIYTLFCLASLSFVASCFSYFVYLNNEKKHLDGALARIESIQIPSLVSALWITDYESVNNELKSITKFDYIDRAEIKLSDEALIFEGDMPSAADSTREWNLIYRYNNKPVPIGSLTLFVGYNRVHTKALTDGFKVFFILLFLSLLLACGISFLFYLLIGRYLKSLALFMSTDDLSSDLDFSLYKRNSNDELDILINQFKHLRSRLYQQLAVAKKAAMEFEEKEREYHHLFQNMHDGFCHHELVFNEFNEVIDYKILQINGRYEIILNKNRGDVIGKLASLVYDTTPPPFLDIYKKVAIKGEQSDFEVFYEPLGIHFHISAYSTRENRFVTIFSDISDQYRAQREIAKARAFLQAALDNSQAGIAIADAPHGTLRYVNDAGLGIRGEDRDKLVKNVGINEYVSKWQIHYLDGTPYKPEDVPLSRALLKGERVSEIFNIKRPDDEWRTVFAKAAPIFNDKKEIEAGIVVFLDISEQKRTEANLVEAMDKAKAANRAKSEFLANMSHEIRTPMNGVLGMLQLLQTTNINEEQKEYILTAIQSSKRLTRLLSDILDLSRVEANRLSIQSSSLNLAEVVDQTCEMFKPTAQQTQVELHCYVDPNIPSSLNGDAARLQQVLTNIIGNAFKFTPKGRIFVEAYPLATSNSNQARILFSVTDSGIGIPDDKVEELFKPFSQVSEGYRRNYQGAGLGLSICKNLVELMGGHIAIESELGEGTTVHFCVTFGVDEPVIRPRVTAPAQGEIKSLRILLAEDDDVNRIATTKLLEKHGHSVKAVEDGEKAISQLMDGGFDVILMDIQMPVMDGVEATKAIRIGASGEHNKNIPIIAMTAYAMGGDKKKFLEAGMNGYISKPVEMEMLEALVQQVFQTKIGK